MRTNPITTPAGHALYLDRFSGAFAALGVVGTEVSGTVLKDWSGSGWSAWVSSLDGYTVPGGSIHHARTRGAALDLALASVPKLRQVVLARAEKTARQG